MWLTREPVKFQIFTMEDNEVIEDKLINFIGKISFWDEFSPYLIFRSVQIACYYSISTIQIFKKWTNAGLFQNLFYGMDFHGAR